MICNEQMTTIIFIQRSFLQYFYINNVCEKVCYIICKKERKLIMATKVRFMDSDWY